MKLKFLILTMVLAAMGPARDAPPPDPDSLVQRNPARLPPVSPQPVQPAPPTSPLILPAPPRFDAAEVDPQQFLWNARPVIVFADTPEDPAFVEQIEALTSDGRALLDRDVVVITGFPPTYEDAYFLIERVSRYESPFGKSYELVCADGDRRVGIEWSEGEVLHISVTEEDAAVGLARVGLTNEELERIDEEQSTDNLITFDDEPYSYRNSYESLYFKDNRDQGEGFYVWEFVSEDRESMIAVVKYEGMPFEVYPSVMVSPSIVNVYRK